MHTNHRRKSVRIDAPTKQRLLRHIAREGKSQTATALTIGRGTLDAILYRGTCSPDTLVKVNRLTNKEVSHEK